MRGMVEASERTQSTGECVPKGEAGRAPLTKASGLKTLSDSSDKGEGSGLDQVHGR
jgi:hypothetical protein